jgi:o-succinylbenzoate synthase
VVTIRRARLVPFAIPLGRPLATAYGRVSERRGFVVLLTDDAGRRGIGEATPHPTAPPETLDAVQADLVRAGRWLVGSDLSQLDRLLADGARLSRPAAMAIDMALHDLLGHVSGRSVADLLGGARRDVVAASALLADHDDAEAARDAVARGFTTAKVKIAPPVDAAVARIAALRDAAPTLALRGDANGAFDVAGAIALAGRLAPVGVCWLEQPVARDDLVLLARVRRDGGVPVAADESVTDATAVQRLSGSVDAIVLKLVQLGGLAAARDAAERAARARLRVTVTSGLETGIAIAAALHLAAALPDPPEPCGLATRSLLVGDLVTEPVPEGPRMRVPRGPGLGIALDESALTRWRTA